MSKPKFSIPMRWDVEYDVVIPNSMTDKLLGKGHGLNSVTATVPLSSFADIEVDADTEEEAVESAMELAKSSPQDFVNAPVIDSRNDHIVHGSKLDIKFICTHPNYSGFIEYVSDSAINELAGLNDVNLFTTPSINSDQDIVRVDGGSDSLKKTQRS